MNNRLGRPFKLLLNDYYWNNILCYYTYDYALGIAQQKFEQKVIMQDLSRHEARRAEATPPAESGGASKVGQVHETARREVDPISCLLKDGLNRAFPSLR